MIGVNGISEWVLSICSPNVSLPRSLTHLWVPWIRMWPSLGIIILSTTRDVDDPNLAIHLLTDICVVYRFWLLWILWVYLSCPKHRLGGLKNRHLLSHSPGSLKSQAKGLTVLSSGWGLFSWIAAHNLLSVSSWTHVASSLCI